MEEVALLSREEERDVVLEGADSRGVVENWLVQQILVEVQVKQAEVPVRERELELWKWSNRLAQVLAPFLSHLQNSCQMVMKSHCLEDSLVVEE